MRFIVVVELEHRAASRCLIFDRDTAEEAAAEAFNHVAGAAVRFAPFAATVYELNDADALRFRPQLRAYGAEATL